MLRVVLAIVSFCVLSTLTAQTIENGIYISFKKGIIPKYAILTVENDSTQIEVFTRWQGEWLPAIGKWDHTYQPQMLRRNEDESLSNENVSIKKKKGLIGILKKTFVGRIKFKLEPVDTLPEKYLEVRQKALEFTRRNDQAEKQ